MTGGDRFPCGKRRGTSYQHGPLHLSEMESAKKEQEVVSEGTPHECSPTESRSVFNWKTLTKIVLFVFCLFVCVFSDKLK